MSIKSTFLVYEHEVGLLYHDGRLAGTLPPGRHIRWFGTWEVRKVDTRVKLEVAGNQEIPTRDEVPVRISVFLNYRITDAVKWLTVAENSQVVLHGGVQAALRDAVAVRTLDEIPSARGELGNEVAARVATVADRIGATVDSVEVRDLTYPSTVRDALVAVVRARKEAQASLEKARGEHAAMRSLLNAARLLDDHPGLLALRTLQAAETGKATLVFGSGSAVVPPSQEPREP